MNALLLVALVTVAQATAPRQRAAPLYEFNTLKTFRCDFTESEGRRTSSQGVTSSATRETFSDLVIDNVDYQRRAARFIGNVGSETVQIFDGEMTVSFLEQTQTGNLNILSIFKIQGCLFQALCAHYGRLDHFAVIWDLPRSALTTRLANTQMEPTRDGS